MASPTYATIVTASAPPDQVLQAFMTGFAGSGATVTLSGPTTLVITRRFTPTWAAIVGIIGIFFFLIGILAFFIKESEVLTVALTPEDGGTRTRVAISGVAATIVADRVNHIVSYYQRQAALIQRQAQPAPQG